MVYWHQQARKPSKWHRGWHTNQHQRTAPDHSTYLGPSALLLRLHTASCFSHPSCYPYLVRGKCTFNNIISKRLWRWGVNSETEESSQHAWGQRHGSTGWDRLEGTTEGPWSNLPAPAGSSQAHGTGPHPPPWHRTTPRGKARWCPCTRNRRPDPARTPLPQTPGGVLPTQTYRAVAASRIPPMALTGRRAPHPGPAHPSPAAPGPRPTRAAAAAAPAPPPLGWRRPRPGRAGAARRRFLPSLPHGSRGHRDRTRPPLRLPGLCPAQRPLPAAQHRVPKHAAVVGYWNSSCSCSEPKQIQALLSPKPAQPQIAIAVQSQTSSIFIRSSLGFTELALRYPSANQNTREAHWFLILSSVGLFLLFLISVKQMSSIPHP